MRGPFQVHTFALINPPPSLRLTTEHNPGAGFCDALG